MVYFALCGFWWLVVFFFFFFYCFIIFSLAIWWVCLHIPLEMIHRERGHQDFHEEFAAGFSSGLARSMNHGLGAPPRFNVNSVPCCVSAVWVWLDQAPGRGIASSPQHGA